MHQQSVARRAKRKAAGLEPEPARIVRPDAGNIAVIDTSDGVVIEPNTFDLGGLSIRFTPNQSGYSATSEATAFSDEARDRGLPLLLGDDDAEAVPLPFPFPYFGETQTQAYVHSDGNVTFEQPETSSTARSLARAASGPPRLAPLFSDLDPSRGLQQALWKHAGSHGHEEFWRRLADLSPTILPARKNDDARRHVEGRSNRMLVRKQNA